jgi:hypothetical protein
MPDARHVKTIPLEDFSLATAVAASSAFPPYFPPVIVRPESLGLKDGHPDFPHPHAITDGGVYGNLGLDQLQLFLPNRGEALILASDAEAVFAADAVHSFAGFLARQIRALDILMARISRVEYDRLPGIVVVRIGKILERSGRYAHDIMKPEDQRNVAAARTDLDDFTNELSALQHHGYALARDRLTSGSPHVPTWCVAKAQNASDFPLAAVTPPRYQAAIRRWRLFSGRDPISYLCMAYVALLLAMGALSGYGALLSWIAAGYALVWFFYGGGLLLFQAMVDRIIS